MQIMVTEVRKLTAEELFSVAVGIGSVVTKVIGVSVLLGVAVASEVAKR